jgi:hypothetical protein
MCRLIAKCVGLVLLSTVCSHAAGVGASGSCPRPFDRYGPRYQFETGTYQARGKGPGGGIYVSIVRDGAPASLPVSPSVFDQAGTLRPGTAITLVGYLRDSRSGAMPPYSCIELAP